ncbi:MAG: sel1 repeat family protein [Myxococcales bacterium]|nr:sel1 repeat family protein [Myxococcales bacterium]
MKVLLFFLLMALHPLYVRLIEGVHWFGAGSASPIGDELAPDGEECARGDGDACMRAALRRQHGDRAKMDLDEALSLHRRACSLGQRRSCAHEAMLTLRQQLYSDKTASAVATLGESCVEGYETACVFLRHLRDNTVVFSNVLRLARHVDPGALSSACAGGDDDACAAGLWMIRACTRGPSWACSEIDLELVRIESFDEERIVQATPPFLEPLRDRCGVDRPRPCALLADYGAPAETERLLDDACEWGHAPSCLRRASTLTRPGSEIERAEALKRACDGGLPRGCSELIHDEMQATGESLERLREGCDLDDPRLCTALARAVATRGDLDQAGALYERACDLGDADGCDGVGLLGAAASLDDRAALLNREGWFLRACALRRSESCERVEELERAYALGPDLSACRAGELERCPPAIRALAVEDPRAASELVKAVLKRSSEACRSSSDECSAIMAIHEITGCGEYGVQECPDSTPARKRQWRKSSALRARQARLLRAECDRGLARSCEWLAYYVDGEDDRRAAKLYTRACELGDAESCWNAITAISGYRDPSETERVKYLGMACTGGNFSACLFLSETWSVIDPRSSKAFSSRARALLENSCSLPRPPFAFWCDEVTILQSLAELGMYAVVVPTLRRVCHGTADARGCTQLVFALLPLSGSWT